MWMMQERILPAWLMIKKKEPDYTVKCRFCDELLFMKEDDQKHGYKHRYTAAIVSESIVDGKVRGKITAYTWLKIKYCPYCGRKY